MPPAGPFSLKALISILEHGNDTKTGFWENMGIFVFLSHLEHEKRLILQNWQIVN